MKTDCCYALQDKTWVEDPDGNRWEVFVVLENNANKDGKFRVLVVEDSTEKAWPLQLRMGGGANGIALLKNVSIWYELWRNINGFPPEYYKTKEDGPLKK